jgi:hypothetical protein
MFSEWGGQDFSRDRYEPLVTVAHAPSSLPISITYKHIAAYLCAVLPVFFQAIINLYGEYRTPLVPVKWVPGSLSPGIKRQGREADHTPPSSAEAKNVELYLHYQTRLIGVVLNKYQE